MYPLKLEVWNASIRTAIAYVENAVTHAPVKIISAAHTFYDEIGVVNVAFECDGAAELMTVWALPDGRLHGEY